MEMWHGQCVFIKSTLQSARTRPFIPQVIRLGTHAFTPAEMLAIADIEAEGQKFEWILTGVEKNFLDPIGLLAD